MFEIPRVCIMIPTYNQAGFIVKAVESALAQDYPRIEIVIADDNSTDNTEEVLQPFITHPRIRYKKNLINLGRVANYRKCLIEYTASEWVINLDGDDYYTNPQFISQAMHAIQTCGINETLFYQGVNIILENGREKHFAPSINTNEEIMGAKDYFFRYFKRNYFSHLSTLYNRQLAIKSFFYELNIISTDIFSFLRLCLLFDEKKVIVSNNISGVWMHHETNASKTLHFKKHWANFKLYILLYRLAVIKGYDKLRCVGWLIKAAYIYGRSYFFRVLLKWKG